MACVLTARVERDARLPLPLRDATFCTTCIGFKIGVMRNRDPLGPRHRVSYFLIYAWTRLMRMRASDDALPAQALERIQANAERLLLHVCSSPEEVA